MAKWVKPYERYRTHIDVEKDWIKFIGVVDNYLERPNTQLKKWKKL